MFDKDYENYSIYKEMAKKAYKDGDMVSAMILSHRASILEMKMLSESYEKSKKVLDAYKQRVES